MKISIINFRKFRFFFTTFLIFIYFHTPTFMHLSHKRMSSILYFISYFTWQFRLRSISAGWSCCTFCSKSQRWRTHSCWWWWRWCWSATTLLSLIIFLRLLHCNEPQRNAFDAQALAGDLLHSGWLQTYRQTYIHMVYMAFYFSSMWQISSSIHCIQLRHIMDLLYLLAGCKSN